MTATLEASKAQKLAEKDEFKANKKSNEAARSKLQTYSIRVHGTQFDPSAADGGAFLINESVDPMDALDSASLLLAGVIDHHNSTLNESNLDFVLNHALISAKAIIDSLIVKEI